MIGKKFVLYSNHETLKFLHNKRRISNDIHAIWVTYLQRFPIKIVYKVGVQNRNVDALREEQPYWSLLRGEITGFDYLKELYEHDEDFGEM